MAGPAGGPHTGASGVTVGIGQRVRVTTYGHWTDDEGNKRRDVATVVGRVTEIDLPIVTWVTDTVELVEQHKPGAERKNLVPQGGCFNINYLVPNGPSAGGIQLLNN